ncbi:g4489 [Coccomyxa elongata]
MFSEEINEWQKVPESSSSPSRAADKGKARALSKLELEEENRRLRAQVAAAQFDSSSSLDTQDGDVDPAKVKVELASIQRQIEELKWSMYSKPDDSLGGPEQETGAAVARAHKLQELHEKVAHVERGLDLCFLVDCTGSMDWCINMVKEKIEEIVEEVQGSYKDAIIRLAFVGYRDYEPPRNIASSDCAFLRSDATPAQIAAISGSRDPSDPRRRFEVLDFLGRKDTPRFRHFVGSVRAGGGYDKCEDVAGGLQNTLQLSWRASTRLVIHFCDAPGHGMAYHDGCLDYFPAGLRIEDLVQHMCNRRIDYYFAPIDVSTVKMSRIMQQAFVHSHNAEFQVMDWHDAPSSFLPSVIKSVRSSMQRSEYFNRMTAAAERKLTSPNHISSSSSSEGSAREKTVFHSIVG